MDREVFIEQACLYAVGALEADERRRFEEYLPAATDEERALLSELMSLAALLPQTIAQTAPPQRVKAELMQKVVLTARAQSAARRRTDDLAAPRPHRSRWLPWGIAAGIAMAAVFALFVLSLLRIIDRQNTDIATLKDENRQLHTRLISLQDELTRKEEQLRVLAAREIHISIMNGLSVQPIAYGKIIWDREQGSAILQVSHLPPVPADKDYQLWIVKGNQKISAGVFAVSDTVSAFFKIDRLAVTNPKEIAAFAVTLEPKGGMPQPTGEMYMLGTPLL